jgi:predicted CXXCH cytochrome family protein
MFNKNTIYYLLACLFLWACSPNNSYRIKSFFFDGVPDPSLETRAEGETELQVMEEDSTIIFKMANTIHPPYEEKACMECHTKENMGWPKMALPGLCYQCHDDLGNNHTYLHGPVDSGNCTQCHHPHKSKIEMLLVRNGQNLCLQCHIKDKVALNKVHRDIEAVNCMECHNPHGGENAMYLQKDNCFQCHEDFTQDRPYIHGPVASGNCMTCHGSHRSTHMNLLVDTGRSLCFNCHDKSDINSSVYHIEVQERSCISCHDPHGSEKEHLLTLNAP